MSVARPIQSKLRVQDAEFRKNESDMLNLIDEMNAKLRECLLQGRPKDLERHQSRGQLLARDRIELLLDEDTPFLELMPLAGHGQEGIETGASMVSGIGLVWYVLVKFFRVLY